VACWLEEGRTSQGGTIHWTLAQLKAAIITEFGVNLSQAALWHMVRQLGFKQKASRPGHARADKQAQESFKKTDNEINEFLASPHLPKPSFLL